PERVLPHRLVRRLLRRGRCQARGRDAQARPHRLSRGRPELLGAVPDFADDLAVLTARTNAPKGIPSVSIASFASAAGQGGGRLGLPLAQAGGTAASTAASAARSAAADSAFRYYGLSMRFTVAFSNGDGIDRLAAWPSC